MGSHYSKYTHCHPDTVSSKIAMFRIWDEWGGTIASIFTHSFNRLNWVVIRGEWGEVGCSREGGWHDLYTCKHVSNARMKQKQGRQVQPSQIFSGFPPLIQFFFHSFLGIFERGGIAGPSCTFYRPSLSISPSLL